MTSSQPVKTTQGNIDPNIIDLGVGHPQNKFLPLELLQKAALTRFNNGDPYFLQYGTRQGDGYLRLALAEFLSQQYREPVDASCLFITNGASMGLALACSLFTQPGDIILVEEPSYFLALKVFADYHLTPIAIPMDSNGLVIEGLEEVLKRHKPSMLYTIPTFQNPSGITLSQERRVRLVELSKSHNFLIVADEVYHFLNYSTPSPQTMAAYIEQGNVLSLGSFSKILAPGLRTGWIHTDPKRIHILIESGLLDSGGGMNPFTSAILRGVLENGGLEANINDLRQSYTSRLTVLDRALRQYLPNAQFQTPQGGYFFWVQIPGIKDTGDYLESAKTQHRVMFNPGSRFSSRSGLRDYMRLCFAYYEEPELEEGVRRLRDIFSIS
ncbi:MAG TPA: PLP-dependent aminotransferase family protein [Anaerolineales bacterium]|nr:PLP-dependent aminotransferase family protein [Anaerolineales bacterium]